MQRRTVRSRQETFVVLINRYAISTSEGVGIPARIPTIISNGKRAYQLEEIYSSMTSIANNTVVKVAAVVAGLVLAFSLAVPSAHAALTESQIQSILSLLQSFGADASTIANVDASLRGTTPSAPSTPSTPSTAGCYTFTRDLTLGSQGADVTALQAFLRMKGHFTHPTDTGYFGAVTQAAVSAWQSANGVSPAAGYFGSISRAKYNMMCGSTTTGPSTPAPTGTGLAVAPGTQPNNSLAPQNASRVPFTRVTVTAGNDGDVVINSFTVQRVGLGSNAAFAGVVLVDDSGRQLGTAKTFNSNDQATIGEKVTIPRGTSKTFTVAGNMASSLLSYAGEAPGISVIGVNTSATVTGSLPITGAFHVINSTLSVGTLSLDVSNASAANATVNREIGTTAFRVSGFRLTAGSAEDVRLRSLRFNQTGSVSSNDLANVMVYVGGTGYPATVSADGKYYDVTLGSGIVIPEGNNVEVYVQYDLVGANSSGRTVIFDVDKTTDIYATGETYAYGISPTTSGGSSVPTSRGNTTETTGTPYIYGNQVTVTGAAITTIAKSSTVPAQNIAVNVPNQPLGAFEVDIRGEAMTVQSLVMSVATSSGSGSGLLTNVTIVDQNGAVVAGPVDATGAGTSLTFSDSITFPVGKSTYTIRGKVASGIGNNTVYTLSTNPSSQWTNVKGDISGNTISLAANTSFSLNAMTVKAASLAVAVASSPSAQNIVAGGQGVLFANIQLDASQSGEDVRVSTIPVTYTNASYAGAPNFLSTCQLKDGTVALNTGSNVVNPTATASTTATLGTFGFDNPLTIAKGTVKTLGLVCNLSSSVPANSTYNLGITSAQIAALSVTGVTSGNTVTPTGSTGAGQTMTVSGSGAVVASNAASNPAYSIAAAGTSGVTMGVFKLRASNEAVDLQRIGLVLTNSASSSAADLVSVTIHKADGTQIGSAVFVGSDMNATSTLSTPLNLPKDTDVEVTIKAHLASVGASEPGTTGHLIAIDIDTAGTNTQGVGVSSGATVNATGSSSAAGVRVFKSFPILAKDTLGATGVADGELMKFKVTANSAGSISIAKFTLTFATTSARVSNVNVYAYQDASYSQPVTGLRSDGGMLASDLSLATWATSATQLSFSAQTSAGASTTIQVPNGGTRYFLVKGSVSPESSTYNVVTTLLGDADFPGLAGFDGTFEAINADADNDFIWSPNTDGSSATGDADWTNGFGVNGLSSGGFSHSRSN